MKNNQPSSAGQAAINEMNPYLEAKLASLFFAVLTLARTALAQDFTLTLQPDSLTLIPNQSASLMVSLAPLQGFDATVALAVESLPNGVTAQFSPSSLTPPGISILTLNAATNAELGFFSLNLDAVGGGITNITSGSVTVNFGLLQTCYGAMEGQVTDLQTGQPVANAYVQAQAVVNWVVNSGATTDANGMYLMTNLALGSPENQPVSYSLTATAQGYCQSAVVSAYAVCNATNAANFQILRQRYGSISGVVVSEAGQPLPSVQVCATMAYSRPSACTNTDTNGAFQLTGLDLQNNNVPAIYGVTATADGYWQASTDTTVAADSNSIVRVVMVPICSNNVIAGVVRLGAQGRGAPNCAVSISGLNQGYDGVITAVTDSNGYFAATNLILNPGNAPLSAGVEASYNGYNSSQESSTLSGCGVSNYVELALSPLPTNNYGGITGHVYDVQSGRPIAKADIYSEPSYIGASTDTNGDYLDARVLLGAGNTTNADFIVYAGAEGYFPAYSNCTLYANLVVTQDFELLRFGYGFVQGTVRDAITGLPIAGATVGFPQFYLSARTDTNGHYISPALQLGDGNVPTDVGLSISAQGYWAGYTNATITMGVTNVVDIEAIKVCTDATIVGNVVDALTQKPITNATLCDDDGGGWGTVAQCGRTDANGNFILTNLVVGNDNSPIRTTLTASAPGYISQSKSITIFCGATINVEFGVPETVFGSIDGYVTNTITGLALSNVFMGTGFGAATSTDSNGYYTLSQVPLGPNGASMTWSVTAMPDGFPAQTESVAVWSNQVSRLDFGFGLPAPVLLVTATAAPDPVLVNSNLLYTIVLTNSIANATNVELADALPPFVDFVGASLSGSAAARFSLPGYTNGTVTIEAASFDSNSAVTLSITVTATAMGTLTNTANVTTTTPNLNAASVLTATTISTATNNSVTPSGGLLVKVLEPISFNPQTGLYQQPILVTNLGGAMVTAVRVMAFDLPSFAVLYNATGFSNGAPYIEYDQSVAAGGSVAFMLQYYDATRQSFVSTNFVAAAVAAASPPTPSGTVLQTDRATFMSEGQSTIEFVTIPGHSYVVQYSSDLQTWETATPPVVAKNTRTQWIDAGPPMTASPPGSPGQRYYRIVQIN